MTRSGLWVMVMSVVLCGVGFSASAEEQMTPAAVGAKMPTAAPLASADGTITQLNLADAVPTLKLADTNGKNWTIEMNATTSVLQQGRIETPSVLKVGDRVQVSFTAEGERFVAKFIQMADATKPVASSTDSTVTSN